MWKVKRMNTARIVVLTIAFGAGGIAAYPASGSETRPAMTANTNLISPRGESVSAISYGVAGQQSVQKRPRGRTI